MAGSQNHSKVINKDDARFPAYMDFNKLRSEGIEYLGKLAGRIWTDHNVHDPGITILEMLCYAILDLGYRTNLPAVDIFTRNPDDTGTDSNFYTPAEILSCNPLTIIDYRKLLIDVEGVRNAWLVPATDITDFCRRGRPIDFDREGQMRDNACETFLNGIYHVYIDLEKDIEEEYRNDEKGKREYLGSIVARVRNALMRHRNLCEDVEDISFLCKLPVGVCANIDLEEGADVEKVYVEAAKALREFLTPTPRFYTLPELLAKNKSIDEIFAGRPYNLKESHGFVDTEELEKIRLRKEIHLSDLYTVLQQVKGVRSVKNLALRFSQSSGANAAWKVPIPENYVLDFRIDYSEFRFSRGGVPVTADFKKFTTLLSMNFSHSGKVLYRSPSPNLDVEIPKGVYRKDLTEYYSIQNEFPRVYGIQEGGLPDNATDLRKSQALQLKGYLLFFDQLLANYLSQLGSMRSLFSNRSPVSKSEQHTYFINQLTNVPEIEKLLRFQSGKSGDIAGLGTAGSFQASPVDKNEFFQLIEQGKLKTLDLESVFAGSAGSGSPPPIRQKKFDNPVEQDIVISQLKNDLYYGNVQTEIVTKADNCVYYYMVTSSESVVLLSNKYFSDEQTARRAASSVAYIGTLDENYRSFTTRSGDFSFDIELNIESFSGYLQLITEDRSQYLERREGFLKHLLARFAEKFTDYALLSFRSLNEAVEDNRIQEAQISATEKFLQHYADISSNRGRAYDYLRNGWNNENISGFEKRVKALTGIENWKRASLCNFIVDTYDEQYTVTLMVAGREFFSLSEVFDSREDAQKAARAIFEAAGDLGRYTIDYVDHEHSYAVHLRLDHYGAGVYRQRVASSQEANALIRNLQRVFSPGQPPDEPFVSQYIFRYWIQDEEGKALTISKRFYETEEAARADEGNVIGQVNDRQSWDDVEARVPELLYHSRFNPERNEFINLAAFKIDIDDTIIGKPDRYTYDVLDKGNRFKFTAIPDFDGPEEAKAHCKDLLARMLYESSYQVRKNRNDRYELLITEGDQEIARFYTDFAREEDALEEKKNALGIVRQHRYDLVARQTPYRWKFRYVLGYEGPNIFSFESVESFPSKEQAAEAASQFARNTPAMQLMPSKGELVLSAGPAPALSAVLSRDVAHDPETVKNAVADLLEFQKAVHELASKGHEAYAASIQVDEKSRQGRYVYRLVDKDHVPAVFSGRYTSVREAFLVKRALARIRCSGYRYLEICLGGRDVINKRKDALTNISWYHYIIRCRNHFTPSGEELILFESTRGFATEEEAENAFLDEYLSVLAWSSDPAQYGAKISTIESPVHSSDPCVKTGSVVFIPTATLNSIGKYPDDSIRKIQAIARSYPIRPVEFQSPTFYTLFPCEPRPDDRPPKRCEEEPKKKKYVYYFEIAVTGTSATAAGEGPYYWRSTRYYEDPAEARKAFDFFIMLLCYPGNFFVDCDPCDTGRSRFRIFIREVLAESARRFPTEADAWGAEGVERMVCVAQSQRSLHPLRLNDCFSFFIACDKSLIHHPCRYDSPQRRDTVVNALYRGAIEYTKGNSHKFEETKEGVELFDADGKAFALLPGMDRKRLPVERVAGLVGLLQSGLAAYDVAEGVLLLRDQDGQLLARAMDNSLTVTAWQEKFSAFGYFFPLVRKGDKYCIELKFPGFEIYSGDKVVGDAPCGCGPSRLPDEPPCHVAWKGTCCYSSIREAYQALVLSLLLLQEYDNYRPVTGCACHDFGIELYFTKHPVVGADINANNLPLWLNTAEIVAFNPQCYPDPRTNCEAIERAWKLINAEGLHVVEHILLRPRCEGDCECRSFRDCDNKTGCSTFTWQEESEDPCAENPVVCFVPGTDPYSFIATVVLPAWPVRFRDKDNRLLLENILQREAPAHVLIRILWLAPHDFCCFEDLYKRWLRWLAGKKNCVPFDPCDIVRFLFDRSYESLGDCDACDPCDDDARVDAPCFEVGIERESSVRYLNQINDLFCWRVWDDANYEFSPCLSVERGIDVVAEPSQPAYHEPVIAAAIERKSEVETLQSSETEAEVELQPARETKEEQESTTEVSPATLKARARWINSRLAGYKDHAVRTSIPDANDITEKVNSFLNDPDPSIDRLTSVLADITETDSSNKGADRIPKRKQTELIKVCVACYLDKVCFKGEVDERIGEIGSLLEVLKKARVRASTIINYWKPHEVKLHLPDVDTDAIVDALNAR